jgi:Cytochrome c oxidase subunit IV
VKVEGTLFAGVAVFYAVMAVAYWVLAREPIGLIAMLLTAGLASMIGFYILFTGRRVGARPEDRVDAEIEEGSGDLGFFSPHSIWPLPLALGAGVIALGLVFGWWLILIGIGVLIFGVIGFVFEYYRGVHAH